MSDVAVNGGGSIGAAVIGVGSFGRHHARIYNELASDGVRLLGLVDTDVESPRELSTRLNVPLVRSLSELGAVPDVVSIAVPTTDHRRVAEPLLRSGVHCLVEKPLAGSTSDARALVEAAEAGGAHLQVGLVERFNPVLSALDRLGEPPVYIEVHRLAPFAFRATDVGVVMDMMIHDLDILNHLVGEEACDVQAVGVRVSGGQEDIANARVIFPSGCVANVTASRVSQRRMRRIRIFSHNAYLRLDYDKREARLVRSSRSVRDWNDRLRDMAARGAGLEPDEGGAGDDLEARLEIELLPIQDAEPLREEISALVRAVRTGRAPAVGGSEGLRALRLAERILAEIRAGEPS